MFEGFVPLGVIVGAHGLNGWLKLNPFNPQTAHLQAGREVVLDKAGERLALELQDGKPHKHQFLIKLQTIDSIDAASRWIGARLLVREDQLDILKSGEYYLYQAIGFDVFDAEGRSIGVVKAVWPTAGAELYVVQGPAKEHLIPAVPEIVEKIDFDTGRIIINVPEGLLDL